MQRAIELYSEGFKLQGDIYLPGGLAAGETRSAILLCHGYTGVKDLYLPDNARVLNEAGYVVMTFRHPCPSRRGQGNSGIGRSRGPRKPAQQCLGGQAGDLCRRQRGRYRRSAHAHHEYGRYRC